MTFTLTEEQTSIVEAAASTRSNLLVIARAGAAKTTTLVEIAKALPRLELMCLAFNKSIAEEMKVRMPQNCDCKTLNGAGYRAYMRHLGRRCRVDSGKMYRLLKAAVDDLEQEEKKEAYEYFSELLRAAGTAKSSGYIPGAALKYDESYRSLMSDEDFVESLDLEPTPLFMDLITHILTESFHEALDGTIDFDDMILMATLGPARFDKPDVTLVDEAQDLNPLQHVMLQKIIGKRRLIAVGDPCQAIYAFRGADESSMTNLQQSFEMVEHYLTISFRCGRKIVENARWRAPDMRWPDWAENGEVLHMPKWGPATIPDGAAVICRNNAPIFSAAISLLRDGRLPEIVGRDVLKGLLTKMKKLGKPKISQEDALVAVDKWVTRESKRVKNKGLVADQAECMKVFIMATSDLGGAMLYAQELMKREGRIKLMTGHKAKGLEFEEVFFLDHHLCRLDKGQDKNVRYVIETRAKRRLVYITSETYGGV